MCVCHLPAVISLRQFENVFSLIHHKVIRLNIVRAKYLNISHL